MNFEIPEIQQLIIEVQKLKATVENNKTELGQEWYNDEQCWKLKGGFSLNTYRTNRFYQVKGGIPDAYVGGRKVWSRKSVQEWLLITDDQLENYHQKYKTGCKRK